MEEWVKHRTHKQHAAVQNAQKFGGHHKSSSSASSLAAGDSSCSVSSSWAVTQLIGAGKERVALSRPLPVTPSKRPQSAMSRMQQQQDAHIIAREPLPVSQPPNVHISPTTIPKKHHVYEDVPFLVGDAESNADTIIYDGKSGRFKTRIFPSNWPISRREVTYLAKYLEDKLADLSKSPPTKVDDIISFSDEVYGACFHEIIRQVQTQCDERAQLLSKVWRLYVGACRLLAHIFKKQNEEIEKLKRKTEEDTVKLEQRHMLFLKEMEEKSRKNQDEEEYRLEEMQMQQQKETALLERKLARAENEIKFLQKEVQELEETNQQALQLRMPPTATEREAEITARYENVLSLYRSTEESMRKLQRDYVMTVRKLENTEKINQELQATNKKLSQENGKSSAKFEAVFAQLLKYQLENDELKRLEIEKAAQVLPKVETCEKSVQTEQPREYALNTGISISIKKRGSETDLSDRS